MKKTICALRRRLIPVTMGIATLTVMSLVGLSTAQTAAAETVEVTITDMGFSVKGHMASEALTAIVVQNKGTIPHGITSAMFTKGVVTKQGDGAELNDAKNKGHMAYHLDPGKSMTLKFVKDSHASAGGGSESIPFWCDIHAHMKGEFLILEAKEVGGM